MYAGGARDRYRAVQALVSAVADSRELQRSDRVPVLSGPNLLLLHVPQKAVRVLFCFPYIIYIVWGGFSSHSFISDLDYLMACLQAR